MMKIHSIIHIPCLARPQPTARPRLVPCWPVMHLSGNGREGAFPWNLHRAAKVAAVDNQARNPNGESRMHDADAWHAVRRELRSTLKAPGHQDGE